MPTAYRIDQIDVRDPHIYADLGLFGCRDITDGGPFGSDGVNDSLNDEVDAFTLNYVTVFRPIDLAAATTPMDFVDGECMAGSPRPVCQVGSMGTVYPTTANNMAAGGTCFVPIPGTVRPYSPAVPSISGPCFVTDPQNITVNVGGIAIPFQQARIAAQYQAGTPPATLNPGVIAGFLTVADAMAIVFPDGTAGGLGGDTLYEHLAAGGAPGSSCRTDRDDRDPHPTTGAANAGFWFYLQFDSIRADWTGP
jgi:hypothetical protein